MITKRLILQEIQNYNEALNLRKKTNLETAGLTPEQMKSIVYNDDLNDAMYELQDMLGVDDGGVCGIYWSEYENSDDLWLNASISERLKYAKEYIQLEKSYEDIGSI